jgi:hypothetical protein
MDEASAAFAARIFPATGIQAGSSALPKEQLFKRMSRSEFVAYIRDTTVSASSQSGAFCCALCPLDLSLPADGCSLQQEGSG